MYGLFDLYSGFDACYIGKWSRPLQAFHLPDGPKQQTTLVQGFTHSMQEFQRRVKHGIRRISPEIVDNFADDCGLKGVELQYNDELIPENLNIRRYFDPCKPSPNDQPYEEIEAEEFLDAYNNTVDALSASTSVSCAQTTKFLCDQLYIHYSNRRVQSWKSSNQCVSLLSSSVQNKVLPDFSCSIPSVPFHSSDTYSLFAATASQSLDSNPPRRLSELYYRSLPVKSSSEFLSGDELVTLEFIAHKL
ncbi:hypothetical protein EV368DRAFT_90481 [Lentinula lateritia]|nr:hypothetical protein EV368DRAFT_90481 [Lentinula lateritia]